MNDHTTSMESVIGNCSKSIQQTHIEEDLDDSYASLFEDDDLDDMEIESQERDMHGNTVEYPELDVLNEAPYEEAKDTIIGTKVQLPHPSREAKEATVKSRKRTHDELLLGRSHDNPMLDSQVYEVEFQDGTYSEYAVNVLLENLYQ